MPLTPTASPKTERKTEEGSNQQNPQQNTQPRNQNTLFGFAPKIAICPEGHIHAFQICPEGHLHELVFATDDPTVTMLLALALQMEALGINPDELFPNEDDSELNPSEEEQVEDNQEEHAEENLEETEEEEEEENSHSSSLSM